MGAWRRKLSARGTEEARSRAGEAVLKDARVVLNRRP
jgi:hypothetical protein